MICSSRCQELNLADRLETEWLLKKLGPETLAEIKQADNRRGTILLLDSVDEAPQAYANLLNANLNGARIGSEPD